MDSSFTQHILERARERQKKIQHLNTVEQVPTTPQKKITSNHTEKVLNISPKVKVKRDSIPPNKDQTTDILKDVNSEDNVRVEVEIQESDGSDNEDTPNNNNYIGTPGLREHAKHKLKKLGRLYAGGEDADISSPINRTEENFLADTKVSDDESVKNNYVKQNPKKGLSKLSALARDISQWEDNFSQVKPVKNMNKTPLKKWKSPAPRLPSIKSEEVLNEIETDMCLNAPTKKHTSPKATCSMYNTENVSPNINKSSKTLDLDQGILKTLESQGFTRTTSNSRLIYNYNLKPETDQGKDNGIKLPEAITENEQYEHSDECQQSVIVTKISPLDIKKEENKVTPRSPKKNIQSTIASKTAFFESSPNKLNNDPALMSLAERKALFEKNKGIALIPKAAFAMPIPISNKENKSNINADVKTPIKNTKWVAKNISDKEINEKHKSTISNNVPSISNQLTDESSGIASKIAALINNKNTISQEQISNNIKEQRERDMEVLLNRFNKNKETVREIPSENKNNHDGDHMKINATEIPKNIAATPKNKESHTPERRSGEKRTSTADSPQVAAVLEDVKRVKVTQPKDGRLYPSLSDIETANETETEQAKSTSCDYSEEESFCSSEDDLNTSFGRDVLQAVCKAQTPQKRPILEEESTDSDISDILDDMDDYLDEAMANENNSSNGPTPPKLGKVGTQENKLSKPSSSFHYKSFSPNSNQNVSPLKKTPMKANSSPRKSSDLPTHVVDGDNILPLTHTVSFYRRQQTPVKTPIRQITRQPLIEEAVEHPISSSENEAVTRKIQELLEEINKQQMVIAQTSQALNLCNSTLEFMGSTEQVEAEKLLLLATHRRQACLHEVQRLKVEGTLRPQDQHAQNIPLEKGTLALSNIVLPLKKEYVRALAAAGGKGHHVVCLIKSGEQVVSTQLVSTVASSSKSPDHDLYIPGIVKLNTIYSDFTVTLEVYCLQAQEEILPHEVKYHISKKGNSKIIPKKTKQNSRMVVPPKESPAGPQAVRSPTFALMGYVIFSVQSINKTHWSLNKVPSMSPLEGKVEMKISCDLNVSVEYKGFLTVFEDISGFGAWHRRWYMLKGHTLSYWKYPDDEKKKPSTESINLKNSITNEVGPVSRDICARLNTFLVETQRDFSPEDKESLTLIRKDNKTIIRHLLSADTKEERIEWCKMFNKALTALKMWGKE